VSGLEFRGVAKSFGAVSALKGVSFCVAEGESHALVGENGAGKSTLLKIAGGIVQADRGSVHWGGERLVLTTPRDALARGIGIVCQEMLAFPNLDVSANIFAGREIVTRTGRLRETQMRERTRELLSRLHLSLSPVDNVGGLPAAHRQLIQVARALAFQCRLLVLDEPTTSLTSAEADQLFRVLEDLRRHGVTLLYVSHRLPEVFSLCDRITVLRDGEYVDTFAREAVTTDRIVQAMVGRVLEGRAAAAAQAPSGTPGLSVKGLSRRPFFDDISFDVCPGEIVGLFGLVGSGRTELIETLFALEAPERGTLQLMGRPVRLRSPQEAMRAGVALVPEERQRQGLFFNLMIADNLVLPHATAHGGWRLRRGEERRASEAMVSEWGIKARGVDCAPDTLSGGNQQKVVLAKWLALRPQLLLLDEPTKGVDVGAKYEIHGIIRRQSKAGAACLLVSSDLPEVLALAQRILVMREGRLMGELAASEADEERVMRLATSEKKGAA